MATRRGGSGKRGGGNGGGGAGDVAGKLALYALATVGGCYLGGKALNLIPKDDAAKSAPSVSARAAEAPQRDYNAEIRKRADRSEEKEQAEAKDADAEQTPKTDEKTDTQDAGKLVDAKADPDDEIGRGEADDPQAAEVTIQEKPHTDKPHTDKPVAPAPGATAAPPAKPAPVRAYPPVEVDRGVTGRKEVAITFDAGSDWKPVRKIVETLASENVKSTFFLTGEWVKKNPKSTRLIAGGGHELGNHSWDHPAFTGLSDDDIKDQLRRTDEIIQETAGRSTHPYFRPPLGARDTRVKRVVGGEGYMTVYWTLDSRDSVDKGITAEQIRDRILTKTQPGSIILMHCGSQATADALPEVIKGLRAKGYTPVPVSRLLQQ